MPSLVAPTLAPSSAPFDEEQNDDADEEIEVEETEDVASVPEVRPRSDVPVEKVVVSAPLPAPEPDIVFSPTTSPMTSSLPPLSPPPSPPRPPQPVVPSVQNTVRAQEPRPATPSSPTGREEETMRAEKKEISALKKALQEALERERMLQSVRLDTPPVDTSSDMLKRLLTHDDV